MRGRGARPRARTFHVDGHHYALVHCTGLEPGSTTPYEVRLDGVRMWPEEDSPFPPSMIRTQGPEREVRIAWGSCRVSAPHEPPYSLRKDKDPRGREVDALRVLADDMCRQHPDEWPHALVLLGDQVYADEVSPAVCDFIRSRRDPAVPPGETVADFEEYTRLYRESWSEPHIRWLLSTVPSAMIFDDHDVHDDWNTSRDWVADMRATGWWDDRIVGGFASYWIYQHMGNLSPSHLAEDDVYERVREVDDGWPILRDFAFRADREVEGTRWSYCRDFGGSRLIMIDSRAGRVLEPPEDRSMIDPDEWEWLEEHAREREFDHLLIGTSLPFLLSPGLHYLESWNEAVCNGVWGRLAAGAGEKIRRAVDLEHWAAFGVSLEPDRLADARGRDGRARQARARVDRGAVGRRPPRVSRRGRLPARDGHVVGRLPGDVLAVPQSARRERAAHDPLRLLAGGNACRSRAGAGRAASRTRRCAGASPATRRTSTTRSASSSCAGAPRGCGCRRPPRARTTGTRSRRSTRPG